MDRRGFMGSILALGAAPAIVRADSLMRIVPRKRLTLSMGGRINCTTYFGTSYIDPRFLDGLSEADLEQAMREVASFRNDPNGVIAIRPTKLIIRNSDWQDAMRAMNNGK